MILGVVAVINGIGILGDESCESVSFGSRGGGRVMAATCFADSSGALPGTVAGIGLVIIGAAIGLISWIARK
jgi:hypothetical protein